VSHFGQHGHAEATVYYMFPDMSRPDTGTHKPFTGSSILVHMILTYICTCYATALQEIYVPYFSIDNTHPKLPFDV
jgi:hypothetical protein